VIRKLLYGSLRRRFQPLAAIALAATVAAGAIAAAAGLGARLAEGAAGSLHAAGPNLLVRPQVGGVDRLPVEEVARVQATPGVIAAAGMLEAAAAADLVTGPDGAPRLVLTEPGAGALPILAASPSLFDLHPSWERPAAGLEPGTALLGARVGAPAGASGFAETPGSLPVAGTVTTGDSLDRAAIVALSALPGAGVDRIEVRAEPERLEAIARAIEARVAGAEARPLVRVTATEAGVAHKLQLLMAGVGAICLLLALATVGSATLALLDERRREVALFLALGYTGRWVQGLLTAELAIVGLAAVVAGSLLGEVAAAGLSEVLLGEAGSLLPSAAGVAAGCVAVAAVVAVAAAMVRRRVERLDPAPVLQGR
jgi:putative ABC transport system permease protein